MAYNYAQTLELVRRELRIQQKMIKSKASQVLNIPLS